MANHLRPKLIVATASIGLSFIFGLLDKKFYDSHIAKRWGSPLQWSDFTGKVDPLSQYDANVASYVYLEFDSILENFYAYAAQINVVSWARESERSDYLLNHEQYHFNITEYHARLMNKYISENLREDEDHFKAKLDKILYEGKNMQKKYDEETTHSLKLDQQRLWEYKIDSLLTLNSTDSGWLTDTISGATIFFPAKPLLTTGFTKSKIPFRIYALKKGDLRFYLTSLQIPELKSDSIFDYLENAYSNPSLKKLSITQEGFKVKVISEDSIGKRTNFIFTYKEPYLISTGIYYYYNDPDTIGYNSIFKSFISTFQILKTETSKPK